MKKILLLALVLILLCSCQAQPQENTETTPSPAPVEETQNTDLKDTKSTEEQKTTDTPSALSCAELDRMRTKSFLILGNPSLLVHPTKTFPITSPMILNYLDVQVSPVTTPFWLTAFPMTAGMM